MTYQLKVIERFILAQKQVVEIIALSSTESQKTIYDVFYTEDFGAWIQAGNGAARRNSLEETRSWVKQWNHELKPFDLGDWELQAVFIGKLKD